MIRLFGIKDFLPNNDLMKFLADHVCVSDLAGVCGDVVFLVCGFDRPNLNEVCKAQLIVTCCSMTTMECLGCLQNCITQVCLISRG